MRKARVIKSTGLWYNLEFNDGTIGAAKLRGKLKLEGLSVTNPIAAGDFVWVRDETDNEDVMLIDSIVERKNYIVRKSTNLSKQMQILAANVDHMYLVVTLISPKTQAYFIDRFLVAVESFRIPITLLFNKSDLFQEKEWQEFEGYKSTYEKLGYPCFAIEATRPETSNFIRESLFGKQVMLGGNSGVGKSSLVNALDPNLNLRTNEISKTHMQGKHTTTFAEMHKMSNGGYIIDTPGIRSFGLIDLEKEHLGHYFPEIREHMKSCKYHNCLHFNEPKCAVKQAVSEGDISKFRYDHYVMMLTEENDSPYRHNVNA